jgi:hypothetical protein
MPATRSRRIIRWTTIAIVTPVLLLVSYVSSWLCVSRAVHEGHLTVADTARLRPVFIPLIAYSESQLPGGRRLQRLWWKVNPGTMETSIFIGAWSPVGPISPSHPDHPVRSAGPME